MKRFEKYHPLMTAHYTLDWLTAFPVKALFSLRQDHDLAVSSRRQPDSAITDSVRYVNQAMRQVMSDAALIWGIEDRQTKHFLGTLSLKNFNTLEQSVEIAGELLPEAQNQGVMTEILNYLIRFIFDELGMQRIQAITLKTQTAAHQLLTGAGFQLKEQLTVLDAAEASSNPLAIYELTAAVLPFKKKQS